MQLESADGKSVTQDVHTALERLGSLINQEMADHFSETTQTITGQLVELADLWLGLADIRFQGFTDEELAPHEVPVLVLFLEEVIANSVRHGGATEIEFRMVVDSRHLELSAIHNGQNAIVEGSGLGVAWLNEYAQRRWEITSHAGRTTLVALINRVI
jgi:signal transduction histidine kinase